MGNTDSQCLTDYWIRSPILTRSLVTQRPVETGQHCIPDFSDCVLLGSHDCQSRHTEDPVLALQSTQDVAAPLCSLFKVFPGLFTQQDLLTIKSRSDNVLDPRGRAVNMRLFSYRLDSKKRLFLFRVKAPPMTKTVPIDLPYWGLHSAHSMWAFLPLQT